MRHRSQHIQLIALGSVILTGCGPELPDDRYVYKTHNQCVQDWGNENCEHGPNPNFGWGGGYGYGPYYNRQVNLPSGDRISSGSPGSPALNPYSNRPLGTTSVKVTRGGFGAYGRSFFSRGG